MRRPFNNLNHYLKSLIFFLSVQLISKHYDVILSSSISFNRGKDNLNMLFSPFIKLFQEEKKTFLILEEPDLGGAFRDLSHSKQAISLFPITLSEMVLRKLFFFINHESRERYIREIIQKIFFRNLKSKHILTLIHHKVELWRLCFKDSYIYDYQHGIMYSNHPGYIKDHRASSRSRENRVILLTHSKIISNILISNDQSGYYNDQTVINLGFKNHVKSSRRYLHKDQLTILFSLQDVDDGGEQALKEYYLKVFDILKEIESFSELKIDLFVKRHPRANKNRDLKLPINSSNHLFLAEDIDIERDRINLHLTHNSSTAIDLAYHGIPTFFLEIGRPNRESFPFLRANKIFLDDLSYPYKNHFITSFEDLRSCLMGYRDILRSGKEDIHTEIFNWHQRLHEDFDKKRTIKVFSKQDFFKLKI